MRDGLKAVVLIPHRISLATTEGENPTAMLPARANKSTWRRLEIGLMITFVECIGVSKVGFLGSPGGDRFYLSKVFVDVWAYSAVNHNRQINRTNRTDTGMTKHFII